MARIQFAAMVEEILGKLAGSVFQDSYIGYQIRGWSKPRNPQTQLSQLRRGDFRFLSSSWRFLTSLEKQTWIDEAGSIPEAFRMFIGNNINLILINETISNYYIPETVPDGLPLQIVAINNTVFEIIASTVITIVPTGCKLLLFATTDKEPTKIFTNPSQYEPIAVFDEGTDFASPVDVIDAWHSHYGQMRTNKRICIKSAIIDQFNGNRSEEYFSCANTNDIFITLTSFIIETTGPSELVEFNVADDSNTVSWQVDFGDGTISTFPPLAHRTVSHTYATAGNYTYTISSTSSTALLEVDTLTSSQMVSVISIADNFNKIFFNGQLLSTAEVNNVLAMVVATGELNGTLFIGGQTPPAPPSGSGITDANTLITRGWTLFTD